MTEKQLTAEEQAAADQKFKDKARYGDFPYASKGDEKYVAAAVAMEVLKADRVVEIVASWPLEKILRTIAAGFSGEFAYSNLREGYYLLLQAALDLALQRAPRDLDEPEARKARGSLACVLTHLRSTYYAHDTFHRGVKSAFNAKITASGLAKLDEKLEKEARTRTVEAYQRLLALRQSLPKNELQLACDDLFPGLDLLGWFDRKGPALGLRSLHELLTIFGFRILSIPDGLAVSTPRFSDKVATQCAWFAQILAHLRELAQPFPHRYLGGLCKLASVLPTAGKRLEQLTYVPSLVDALDGLLALLNRRYGAPAPPETPITKAAQLPRAHLSGRCVHDPQAVHSAPAERKKQSRNARVAPRPPPRGPYFPRQFPIIVFDQSADGLYQENGTYLAGLARRRDAKIFHVSWPEILELGSKLGIPELFGTTVHRSLEDWGAGRVAPGAVQAGFGGARNISYLMGAMFHAAILRRGVQTFRQLIDLSVLVLADLLEEALKGQLMMLAGDDDMTVFPGFMHAKALLVEAYESRGRFKIVTRMMGRATMTVPVDVWDFAEQNFQQEATLELYEATLIKAVRTTAWVQGYRRDKEEFVWPGMATAVMHLGACLDLPLPSEEGQFDCYEYRFDCLSDTVHHAGDRYDKPAARIKAVLYYTLEFEFPNKLIRSDVLHWNAAYEHAPQNFNNLRDVFRAVVDPTQAAASRARFLAYLHAFTTPFDPADQLQGFDRLVDDSPPGSDLGKELKAVKAAIEEVVGDWRRALEFKRFLIERVLELDPAATHPNPLSSFQAILAANPPIQSLVETSADHFPRVRTDRLSRNMYLTALSLGGGRFFDLIEELI